MHLPNQSGCQIDYMIQTRTNVVYVCEMKFSRHEIKEIFLMRVKAKIDKLSIPRGMSFCHYINSCKWGSG